MGKWDDFAARHAEEVASAASRADAGRARLADTLRALNESLTADGLEIARLLVRAKVPRVDLGAVRAFMPRGWRLRVDRGDHDNLGAWWDLSAKGRWVSALGPALPLRLFDDEFTRVEGDRASAPDRLIPLRGLDHLSLDPELRPVVGFGKLSSVPLDQALERAVRELLGSSRK